MISVTPVDDIELHEEGTACKCCPKVYFENGEMIVVHNSFDGREGVEWTNELLESK